MKRVLFALAAAGLMAAVAFPVMGGAPGAPAPAPGAAAPGGPGAGGPPGGGRRGGGGRGAASSTLTQARASAHDVIHGGVGGDMQSRITIYYGRPNANGRTIWGTLVPWETEWRMGSDEATTLITQKQLDIGGLTVPAGAYTLYMLPSQTGPSKLVVNKQIGQWGIPINAAVKANELGRADLTKEPAVDPQVDQFTMAFANEQGGTKLNITWEKTRYSVLIKVKP